MPPAPPEGLTNVMRIELLSRQKRGQQRQSLGGRSYVQHAMGHEPAHDAENDRALKISGWLTGVYFIIELAIGLATGSIAVISDAFHTFSAVGGVILAWVAARVARRPANLEHTFGYARAEIIGAMLNGFFLLAMALLVIVMGLMRLSAPIDLPTTPMLLAAAGGITTEVISLAVLFRGQKDNLNMKGAFWHVIQTFIGSVLIVITALVIQFTGFLAIDPILGTAFGVVLLLASISIIRESFTILMEASPRGVDIGAVVESLRAIWDVEDVHHVHAWVLTSNRNVFSAHLRVNDNDAAQPVLKKAHKALREDRGFYFSTLQIETACLDEEGAEAIDPQTHQQGDL